MSRATHGKLSVSLPFEVIKVLDDFAEVSQTPRSAVIAALLEEAMPVLKMSAQSLRELAKLDQQQRQEIASRMADFEKRALEQQRETGANAQAALRLIHSAKFAKI